jgi:endonuclease/exonuclease/phosphatase family metal-dependent hydrolase
MLAVAMRRKRRQLRLWVVLVGLVLGLARVLAEPSRDAAAPEAKSAGSEAAARGEAQRASTPDAADEARAPVKAKPVTRARKGALAAGPFASPEHCRDWLTERGKPTLRRAPRFGTWNVRWFPRGTADGEEPAERTDVEWLACAIASLDVDVLAVQEFLDNPEARRAALDLTAQLDAITGGRFKLELDECAGSGRQHVGFLWNSARVQVDDVRVIARLNPKRSACDASLRPGLAAHVRFADGTHAQLVSVHLDSGVEARDYQNRRTSVQRMQELHAALRGRPGSDALIVLGDWNSMGCSGCEPAVSADEELSVLDAELEAAGLRRARAGAVDPCTHYYRGRGVALDHVALPKAWTDSSAAFAVGGVCDALACLAPARGEPPAAWQRLSDHCPLVVELKETRSQASGR